MPTSVLVIVLDPACPPSCSALFPSLPSSKYRLLPDTEIVPSWRRFSQQNKNFEALTEKIIAETVDFGVVQINSGSTAGLAIPAKDGYTIASATPYSNSGSESTQTNVITFVNAVSGAKKAFYKNTSSSAISNRLMVDIIYVKSN